MMALSDLNGRGDASYLNKMQNLRNFEGDPVQFWSQYLELLIECCDGRAGLIAVAVDGMQWKLLAFSPSGNRMNGATERLRELLPELYAKCSADGTMYFKDESHSVIGMRCGTGSSAQPCVMLAHIDAKEESVARKYLAALGTMNDLPGLYQVRKSVSEALVRQEHLKGVLDVMALLNEHEKFLAAAMTLCNEIAARHHCERVNLGWHERGYVRIKAMSHIDTFDKKMDAIKKLELAMEESFDQNIEIVLPGPDASMMITRDHEVYRKLQDVAFLCTLPLRIDNKPVALCTLERNSSAFGEGELRLLRLTLDHAARRLDDFKQNDYWFGKLILQKTGKMLRKLFGFEHSWAKALGITAALALGFVCFVPITYRLESTAILRTDAVSFLTAPFDGHIEKADKRIGDDIKSGGEIIRLDQSDLLLQEAELSAEKVRYSREAEKAEASGALADMLIAQAMRDQTAARLEIVLHKLNKATMQSPFDGVIVEGDLTERIGSPVKQGDVLYKIARLEGLYAEIEVKETEIHNARNARRGQIALASRPQEKQEIVVDLFEPVAVAKNEGNVFVARCSIQGKVPQWWRPGMTGVAKLDAGRRTLVWIITHRTTDFLRLKLWW